jgi:hypothetical protein
MARTRKTISVEELRDAMNHVLANSVDDYRQGRIAVALTLESILMSTGNYRGYGLLGSEFLPADEQVGNNVLRADADDTRRRYY